MKTEFENGCVNPATLEIYNKFYPIPHCVGFVMYADEDDENETVVITFNHYSDQFEAIFNVDTGIAELFILPPWEIIQASGEDEEVLPEYYGIITVDKLVELLSKLPHILDYVEDEAKIGATIH